MEERRLSRDDVLEELGRSGQLPYMEIVEEISMWASSRPSLLTRDALEHLALRLRVAGGAEGGSEASESSSGGGSGGAGIDNNDDNDEDEERAMGSSRRSLGGTTRGGDDVSASAASTPRFGSATDIEERLLQRFLDAVFVPAAPRSDGGGVDHAAAPVDPASAPPTVPRAPSDTPLSSDGGDGISEASAHDALQDLQVDPRLFNPLLLPLSTTNPAMYQSLLGHPLITGKVGASLEARDHKSSVFCISDPSCSSFVHVPVNDTAGRQIIAPQEEESTSRESRGGSFH